MIGAIGETKMIDNVPSEISLAAHAKRTLVSVCIFLAVVVLLLALWNFADVMLYPW